MIFPAFAMYDTVVIVVVLLVEGIAFVQDLESISLYTRAAVVARDLA